MFNWFKKKKKTKLVFCQHCDFCVEGKNYIPIAENQTTLDTFAYYENYVCVATMKLKSSSTFDWYKPSTETRVIEYELCKKKNKNNDCTDYVHTSTEPTQRS